LYGISAESEGGNAESEIGSCNVYRFDPKGGSLRVVADDFSRPNGLAFSPDENVLYIADSGFWPDPTKRHHNRAFDVGVDGRLGGGRLVCEVSPGIPDGFRIAADGNIGTSSGSGVQCITSNVTFGGPKRNRLFICGHTSLYAIFVNTEGAQRP
jgi:gluconolactonase